MLKLTCFGVDHFKGTGQTRATLIQIYGSLLAAWAYARLVLVNQLLRIHSKVFVKHLRRKNKHSLTEKEKLLNTRRAIYNEISVHKCLAFFLF